MVRAIAIFVLVTALGCGRFGPVRRIGGLEVAVQAHAVGPARLVGFVEVKRSVLDSSVKADFAMLLPDGDWLAQLNGSAVRLSADGKTVRWTKSHLAISDAVVGPEGRAVCVSTGVDPAAPTSLFMLDLVTGAVVWRATPAQLGTYRPRIARVGRTTVAASTFGLAAVDDEGKVLWEVKDAAFSHDEPWLVPQDSGVVVISTPILYNRDFKGGVPLHTPLVVRTFAVATGEERGRFELPADNDYYSIRQLGLSRDGRIALYGDDIRDNVTQSVTADGKPTNAHSSAATSKIVVIDAGDFARPRARATAIELPAGAPEAVVPQLARSEVAFVDHFAASGDSVALTIVDLSSARVRRARIVRTSGTYSHVRVVYVSPHADGITFAGLFSGHALPLRGRLEIIDWCKAWHGVSCADEHKEPTHAPYAGLIGFVRL